MFRIYCNGTIFTVHTVTKLPRMYRTFDYINEALEYDTFEFVARSNLLGEQRLLERDGLWLATNADEGIVVGDRYFGDFHYGDEVIIEDDGVDGTTKGKFYLSDIQPLNQRAFGDQLFRVRCVSAMGILANTPHMGGVYSGRMAGQIIRDIMSGPFAPSQYRISDALMYSTPISGWLPATNDARTNLHKVLFAVDGHITMPDGATPNFVIGTQSLTEEYIYEIPKSRIFYTGANVENDRKASVSIAEHQFYKSANATEEVLYDNTTGSTADEDRIVFSEPHYDYRADGLTIVRSEANYADVSGNGKLYGKPYTHFQKETSVTIDNSRTDVLRITDQTLVSPINISAIVERFRNYYSTAQIRKFDFKPIRFLAEVPGKPVFFYDNNGDRYTGYISKMDEGRSSFWRSATEAITNWIPSRPGNSFTKYKIVTSEDLVNGVWNVPSDMIGKTAYITLFSGAQGGQGGYAGEPVGENYSTSTAKDTKIRATGSGYYLGGKGTAQRGGAGGKGGAGGAAAARFISFLVIRLSNSHNVTFGAGGEGGVGGTCVRSAGFVDTITEPELGAEGEDSYFDDRSTENGTSFRGIYANLLTGEVIAQAGEDGIAGGDGGMGGRSNPKEGPFDTEEEANAYDYTGGLTNGRNGGSVAGYAGGAGAVGHSGFVENLYEGGSWLIENGYYVFCSAGGGGGGGAAMGAAGQAGQAGQGDRASWREDGHLKYYYYVNSYTELNHVVTVDGGKGGDGANATLVPDKVPYRGGYGGHGGGGGGGSAMCVGNEFTISTSNRENNYGSSYGGKGGNGGKGGDGSDGFMIVYY